MRLSPDTIIFWQWGPISLNATIVFTWLVMGLLVLASWLATRHLTADTRLSRWQSFLEALVTSENASRLASMQVAERNIGERLEELHAESRHRRQTSITEELLDIVAGLEALVAEPKL
jgi:hypothetical protein